MSGTDSTARPTTTRQRPCSSSVGLTRSSTGVEPLPSIGAVVAVAAARCVFGVLYVCVSCCLLVLLFALCAAAAACCCCLPVGELDCGHRAR